MKGESFTSEGEAKPLLRKNLPLSLDKGFASKELHPCHPERSEGSRGAGDYLCTASPTHGFFVIPISSGFSRMTFEARPFINGKGDKGRRSNPSKKDLNSSRGWDY